MDEAEQLQQVDHALRERLIEVQKHSDPRSLAIKNSPKWLQIASLLAVGCSKNKIQTSMKCDRQAIYRIEREIQTDIEEFRACQARNVEIAYSMIGDALLAKAEKMAESDGMFDANEAKALKETSVSFGLLEGTAKRLRGGADVVIEHRKAKTPEELASELKALFEAETIDVTPTEDNDEAN